MKITIKDICTTAIFTAITAIMAQIAIPLPFSPVPITMQTFAIFMSAIILGSRLGFMSQIIYVLLGAIGVPVFANFGGGLGKILGPTGGFIFSFPIVAYIIGRISDKKMNMAANIAIMAVGLFVCYAMGVAQLSVTTGMGMQKAIAVGALPYIPLDIVKVAMAYVLGTTVRNRLVSAKLIGVSN